MDRGPAVVLTAMTKNLYRLIAAAFTIASLGAATAPAMAAKHHRHHHASHHGIAQHNRGDRDGDNNGGRDDRDGRV
jgi:hypothetical protein